MGLISTPPSRFLQDELRGTMSSVVLQSLPTYFRVKYLPMSSHSRLKTTIFIVGVLLGIVLRLVVATRGHNFDLESFLIVADIVERGGNVYNETLRYNYGPIWSYLVFSFKWLSEIFTPSNGQGFSYIVTGFLTLVDLGIMFVLLTRFGRLAALFFFLNPITIIISGYHRQFGNFAILIGMLALIVYGENYETPLTKRKVGGLALLGLSLVTKHLLFLFPLWLAIKQRGLMNKLICIVFPLGIFALGFLPFWGVGREGIINNVLEYASWENHIFWTWHIPKFIRLFLSAREVFLIVLVVGAFLFRDQQGIQSLTLYLALLVATSPSMTNQYLAIPISFIALNINLLTILYSVAGGIYLTSDFYGLNYAFLENNLRYTREEYYAVLITVLLLGILWSLYKDQFIALFWKTVAVVREQLVPVKMG